MFKDKSKENNEELKDIYLLVNDLIRDGKIKFDYYKRIFH